MLANTGLTAAFQGLLMIGALGVAIIVLSIASFTLLSGERHDRPGPLRALAVGDLITGALSVWVSGAMATPAVSIPLGIVAVGLVLAGVQLLRKSTAEAGANKSDEGTTDEQFWEQFDE